MQVLDQGDLENLGVRHVELDAGHFSQPRLERRAESPLPCDDPQPALGRRANEKGLEHSFRLDRLHELPEVSHARARLLGIRFDLLDRDEPAERLAESLGEGLDEMGVVAHPRFRGQAPSSARHAREPPRIGSSTLPRRSSAARR